MAGWLAIVFAAGGSLILLVLVAPVLPVPASTNRLGSACVSVASIGLGGMIWLLREWITTRSARGLLAVATACVTVGAYFWGAGTSDAAMFYIWIVVYSAYFFGARGTVAYLTLIGAGYAAVLLATGSEYPITRWTLSSNC